jgi:hypothetical protein
MTNWIDKLFMLNPCIEARNYFTYEGMPPKEVWNTIPRGDWLIWLCFNLFPERADNLVIRLLKTHITNSEILAVLPDVITGRTRIDEIVDFKPYNDNSYQTKREILVIKSYEIYVHENYYSLLTEDIAGLCTQVKLADYIRHEFSFEEVFEALNNS